LVFRTYFEDKLKMLSNNDQVRLVVLGMNSVGKSALTVRLLTRRFITEYANGRDSAYVRSFIIQGRSIEVKIIDHGDKRDPTDLIRWGDGFLLVYSVENRESLEEAKNLKKKIDAIKVGFNRNSCVMVGNKADLGRQRKVTTMEARTVAREIGCRVFEVSAANDIEPVFDVFSYTISRVLDSKEQPPFAIHRTMKSTNASEGGKRLFGKMLSMKPKTRDRTKTL